MARTTTRSSGLLLVGGVILFVAGSLVAPAGAYQGPLDVRQAIIDANHGQWLASKVLDGLALMLPIVGYVLLAGIQARDGGSRISLAAGLVMGLAGVVGLVFVYQLTTNPLSFYDRPSPAPLVQTLVGLLAAGILLFGASFIQEGLPRWLGGLCLVIGAGILALLLAIRGETPLVSAGPEAAFGLMSLVYLVSLVVGIVLMRRQPVQA